MRAFLDSNSAELHAAPSEGVAPVHTTTASTVRGRYEFLDAVRGLAALLVALQHFSEGFQIPPFGVPIGRGGLPINLGETGVVAFFLVSGFIIPRSLERHRSLAIFWIGRAFRLYPAYWLSLAGVLILIARGSYPPVFAHLAHPWLGAVVNATMLQQIAGVPHALAIYWTLSLELIFYVLCSALFVAGVLRRSGLCLWSAIGLMLVAELTAAALGRSIPAGRIGLLVSAFFGTVALRALTEPRARRTLRLAGLPLTLVLGLGLYLRFALFPVPHEVAAPTWPVVLLSWLLGYGLFFGLYAMRHRKLPRPLLWLGRISYSFYLWHVLVLAGMPVLLNSHVLTSAVDLLLTALLAQLSFGLAERPALRLQRKLLERRLA